MSPVRIAAYCLRSVVPLSTRDGTHVALELELTPAQRFAAVEQLLGVGIGEQQAYEWIPRLFPEWFESQPRLIAAAPELLAALINLVGTMCAADGSDMEADLDAIDARVGEARAAIAKATGEAA